MISATGLIAIKVFVPAIFSFTIGLIFAPAWLSVLNNNQMWKKKAKELTIGGHRAEVFQSLHGKNEIAVPRMGGVVIWTAAIATSLILWVFSQILPANELMSRLDFISRGQTWIPLFTLLLGATVGLIDDYFEVKGKTDYGIGGLSLKKRLLFVSIIGFLCGWWFYYRLEVEELFVPLLGNVEFGILIIPLFIIVMLGSYSGGVIDGIDGLSGGVFASIFSAYGVIALIQDQFNIAALCFVLASSTLAFLWYNLPPAKYYMTETGTMSLTITLAVIAFLTDQVFLLPIIAMPLVITPVSNIIQLTYKKKFGRKLFHITPIHHHFEAIGIPGYQITMKYWIISVICGLSGIVLALMG